MPERIYLSPPHMSGKEIEFVQEAFSDNWIAPAGPHLAQFEQQFCEYIGAKYALAVSSGTAAIHLGLIALGVQPNDDVMVSTLTFAGSIYPIIYTGAKPVFIDSDSESWNIDPNLLEDVLKKKSQSGKLPKVLIPVHLYGQPADMEPIVDICEHYGIAVLEDAAEAIGSRYRGTHPGTWGKISAFSFNGNKIITTSGGGILVSNDQSIIDFARKLSTQAREPVAHYEHKYIGYNYRMSNIVAAIGCGQLQVIEERVHRKREIYEFYKTHLSELDGLTFVDEMSYAHHTRWLSVLLVDDTRFGVDRETIRLKLESHNIESRAMWKPMHLQPIFQEYEVVRGSVAEKLFEQGLCLPSGTALTNEQLYEIVSIIKSIKT